jgi:hypothetical protein
MLTVDQILADHRRMKKFICERIPADTPMRIVLAHGSDGPLWVDLLATWDYDGDCDLLIESNEPDAVGLRAVYEHFRRQEMTWDEVMKEERASLVAVKRLDVFTRAKTDDLPKPNKSGTLTVRDAADELNCSISFVYKLMCLGELIYEKRGRRRLPTAASITDYRNRNIVRASQRFDFPKKDAHEPYVYQQLFKKVRRKRRDS